MSLGLFSVCVVTADVGAQTTPQLSLMSSPNPAFVGTTPSLRATICFTADGRTHSGMLILYRNFNVEIDRTPVTVSTMTGSGCAHAEWRVMNLAVGTTRLSATYEESNVVLAPRYGAVVEQRVVDTAAPVPHLAFLRGPVYPGALIPLVMYFMPDPTGAPAPSGRVSFFLQDERAEVLVAEQVIQVESLVPGPTVPVAAARATIEIPNVPRLRLRIEYGGDAAYAPTGFSQWLVVQPFPTPQLQLATATSVVMNGTPIAVQARVRYDDLGPFPSGRVALQVDGATVATANVRPHEPCETGFLCFPSGRRFGLVDFQLPALGAGDHVLEGVYHDESGHEHRFDPLPIRVEPGRARQASILVNGGRNRLDVAVDADCSIRSFMAIPEFGNLLSWGAATGYVVNESPVGVVSPYGRFTLVLEPCGDATMTFAGFRRVGDEWHGVPFPPGVALQLEEVGQWKLPSTADLVDGRLLVRKSAIAATSRATLFPSAPPLPSVAFALTVPQPIAIEFENTAIDHYFLTGSAEEAGAIDRGSAGPAWKRTSLTFNTVHPRDDHDHAVCRFFGVPGRGPNSHFYTADPAECQQVRGNPDWQFEEHAFHARLPVDDRCAPGDRPVYRALKSARTVDDVNHRFTTDALVYDGMIARGWIGEGVAMCVPW